MPFRSKSQMRLCYQKQFNGTNKSWNCDEWTRKTNRPWELPQWVGSWRIDGIRENEPRGQRCSSGRSLCRGTRGGTFIIRKGVKIYINKKSATRKNQVKKSKPVRKSGSNRKVHTGPRGGKYIVKNGRRVYI